MVYYHPPKKLHEGNVFSLVCLSVGSQGGPQMTTFCDTIGQSQVTWEPQDMFKCVYLGTPHTHLFKLATLHTQEQARLPEVLDQNHVKHPVIHEGSE